MDAPPEPKRRRLTAMPLLQYSMASQEERELYSEFAGAAKRGSLKIVRRMLNEDVPVDCPCDSDNTTALLIASNRGSLHVVHALRKAGANVNFTALNGRTALHAACEGRSNVQVVAALLKAGAQVDAKDHSGRTPLIQLMHRYNRFSPRQVEIARLLMAAGCNVNAVDNDGTTPLHGFLYRSDMDEAFRFLIEAGADLMTDPGRDVWESILHTCAQHSDTDKLQTVLDCGIDMNTMTRTRNEKGQTALHIAVEYNSIDVTRFLLQFNDNDKEDGFGPPENSIRNAHMASVNPVRMPPPNDHSPLLRLIDCKDEHDRTALHDAVGKKSLEIVQELLNHKPNLRIESRAEMRFLGLNSLPTRHLLNNRSFYNPLDMALCLADNASNSSDEDLNVLKCLLEHPNGYGPDQINDLSCRRSAALHLTVEKEICNLAVVEYLSNCTDVRIQDIDGNTALHLAIKRPYAEAEHIMRLLLRSRYAKEAVKICNDQGTTVLHDAIARSAHRDIVLAIADMADVNLIDRDGTTL